MKKCYLAWRAYRDRVEDLERAAEGAKDFLSRCKTERESTEELERRFRGAGFKSLDECERLSPGDGIFMNWHNRAFIAYRAGETPFEDGFGLIGAHADSPRIDIKCKPLYEEGNLLMADAHYYGGIKKYQWTNVPTSLHGEVFTKDGKMVQVRVGEEGDEPVFLIPDLAPHLDRKLSERKADKTIEGENLDAIFAHRPDLTAGEDKESEEKSHILKSTILALLKSRWGIESKELASAELCLVPAGRARDAGLEGGLIASYGIDDRICVWAAAEAMLSVPAPKRGTVFVATDREEIGSYGIAGSSGRWLEHFLLEVIERSGVKNQSLALWRALARSQAISADVTEAFNPIYKDAFDPRQTPYAGNGITLTRSSGSGGKYSGSEARGEYVAQITAVMEAAAVPWQVGSLGKVDGGGGGTIAVDLAALGMDTLDLGPAVLSLHSPWEMVSKADVLATLEAYRAFYSWERA